MSEKKKKNDQVQPANAIVFILFWVISLGFLQVNYWSIWINIYDFITQNLPQVFHRLWIAYLLHGLVIGLGFGLTQKVAIQALSTIRIKYWLRINLFIFTAAKLAEYSVIRFIDWRSYGDTSLYYLAISLISQIVLVLAQYFVLRKHYRQAWLWMLVLIPTFWLSFFGYLSEYFAISVILQALPSALALLWMNHQSIAPEKAKNTEEAESRLADTLPEEEVEQELSGRYQTSES